MVIFYTLEAGENYNTSLRRLITPVQRAHKKKVHLNSIKKPKEHLTQFLPLCVWRKYFTMALDLLSCRSFIVAGSTVTVVCGYVRRSLLPLSLLLHVFPDTQCIKKNLPIYA